MTELTDSYKTKIADVSILPWPLFYKFATHLGFPGSFTEQMSSDSRKLELEKIATGLSILESDFNLAREKTGSPLPFSEPLSAEVANARLSEQKATKHGASEVQGPKPKSRMEELLRVLHGINATTENIHQIAAQHWGKLNQP